MAKLGYTWYPKDWGNSDAVFELTLIERGLYRELIDMAMLSDNKVIVSIKTWARKFGSTIDEIESILITLENLKLIELRKDILFIPSCESRLNLVRGGSKGGKNKPSVKPTIKPTDKPIESLPLSKRKEKEIESQIKVYAHEILNANPEINYEGIRKALNTTLNTNHLPYNKNVQLQITELFKNGVTIEDMKRVAYHTKNDEWHKKNKYTSCSPPVFFTQEHFDRYNRPIEQPKEKFKIDPLTW